MTKTGERITTAAKAEGLADRFKQQAESAADPETARQKYKRALGLLRRALYLCRGHNNRDRIKAEIDRLQQRLAGL